jgi:hypothetical protein
VQEECETRLRNLKKGYLYTPAARITKPTSRPDCRQTSSDENSKSVEETIDLVIEESDIIRDFGNSTSDDEVRIL